MVWEFENNDHLTLKLISLFTLNNYVSLELTQVISFWTAS